MAQHRLAVAIGLALAAPAWTQEPPLVRPLPPADGAAATSPLLRRELERLERVLDLAVRKVSQAIPSGTMASGSCRGYHLRGYGAVFVLAPRSLPQPRTRVMSFQPAPQGAPFENAIRMLEDSLSHVDSPEMRAVIVRQIQTLRAAQRTHREPQLLPPVNPGTKPAGSTERPKLLTQREWEEQQLRAAEEQARAFQREAEKARQDAEHEMQGVALELQRRMGEGPAAPAAETPAPSEAVPLAPPEPPWLFWLDTEEEPGRTPDTVIRDVSAAVTEALESQGARLEMLAPEEYVVVAVDFYGRGPFNAWARPHRTLVVRVRKQELVERHAGRLPAQELRKRIEYIQY